MANTGAMIVDRGMGPNPEDLVVKPPVVQDEMLIVDPRRPAPPLPVEGAPDDLSVQPASGASQADLSVYGVNGRYGEPELSPAGGQYSTPYYSAYTNDNDFAGAVMASPGQKIRMVDPSNGDVIYEGEGPEGARMATQIANAISQEKGRHAAWQIQGDYGAEGWKTQAAERYDPKKQSTLGKLADIALPILGVLLMPVTGGMSAALAAGLGAAGGSALSSIAQGRSLSDTLIRAAVTGVGAGVVGPAVGNAVGSLGGGAAGSATGSAAGSGAGALSSAATFTAAELAGAVAPLTVTAAAGSGLGSAIGAGAGALAGGAASNGLSGGSGTDVVQPPTDVEGITVTAQQAAQQGMTLEQMIAMGIPATVAVAAITAAGGSGSATVEPLTVEANPLTPAPDPITAIPPVVGAPIVTNVPDLTTANLPDASTLDQPQGPLGSIADWIKNNPDLLALLLPALTAGGNGGTGQYTVPTGPGTPGTRESLGPTFTSQLPPSNLAVRQPRDMSGTDWKRYGMGPEKSFFTNVPQGLARGGSPFSVRGSGDGRSDDIDARLSDGEYVIDAETVALLGNGSSRAGAEKLDRFRVNVRKQKGRDLVAGRFSADAHEPETYFAGGRT